MKIFLKSLKSPRLKVCATGMAMAALAACSSGPKPADWQLEAKGAMDRSVSAWLEGNSRVEGVELARARAEISSTGRVDLMARAELLHCASHVASLVFEPCAGFETLRADAAAPERAYADYLAGKLQAANAVLLPPQQQAAAGASDASIAGIADPLSRLVAAGVAFEKGRATPVLVQQAIDTASAQGWRRPLLAWLGVQAELAGKAGDAESAARIQRRIALTLNALPKATPLPAAPSAEVVK